ncbi:MAG: SOS response-associated peptidase [Gammaproteobacteria bacterium]|nr:SOS response-associated peptidase [Gammaproteobacteria bacterium]
MRGRYNVIDNPETESVMNDLGVEFNAVALPLYNLCPTAFVPIVILDQNGPKIVMATWWLLLEKGPKGLKPNPKWKTFNAVAKREPTSKLYAPALKKSRCILPSSGYYEWKGKQAYYIKPQDKAIAFAGLYRRWEIEGNEIHSCTLMTTMGHAKLAHIHEKSLPVMLPESERESWLSKEELPQSRLDLIFQSRLRDSLEVVPVSQYVNNADHRGEQCVEPVGEQQTMDVD